MELNNSSFFIGINLYLFNHMCRIKTYFGGILMKTDNKPVRIAQIMGYMNGAGVETVVTNYYKFIDKSKIQFDFICCNGSTNIPYDEIKKQGGNVIIVPSYKKIFSFCRKLEQVLKENDYKMVHSHINALSVFSLLAAKNAGIKVRIAHSHSSSNKKEKIRNVVKNFLRLFSKVFATDYIACSELAGRWLFGNKAYEDGKVMILNNAIDLNKFLYNEKIRKSKRKELGISEDTFVVGHIGRFMKQKNHDYLMEIFNEIHKKNNDSLLLLAGQGPLLGEIKSKVSKLKLDNSVVFLGQRNDANELYQAFDLFILPSLYEGLPVVGIEAQVSGLPCLFSNDMTKETKMLKTTHFLSLDDSPEKWASEAIKYLNYKRKNEKKEIENSGFDIEREAIKLQNYYLSKK